MLKEEKQKHIFKLLYNEGLICDEKHEIYKNIEDIDLFNDRNEEPTGCCKYKKESHYF